jgi:hypothetical protein
MVQQYNKKWVTFTYHGPSVYKDNNLFKRSNLRITLWPINTIYQQISNKTNNPNLSGVYQLKCNTRNRANVEQFSRPITTRHRDQPRYIRNNDPTSAYTMHILDNRHEFGSAEETLKFLKPCTKGNRMNCWEALFIHIHHKHNILITEEEAIDTNPLFKLASIPRDLMHVP